MDRRHGPCLSVRYTPVPTPWSSLFLEPMGGAIAPRGLESTAFPHRERMFCVTAVPAWRDVMQDTEMVEWADRLFEPLLPYAVEGAYVNYLDDIGEAAATAPAAHLAWAAISGV